MVKTRIDFRDRIRLAPKSMVGALHSFGEAAPGLLQKAAKAFSQVQLAASKQSSIDPKEATALALVNIDSRETKRRFVDIDPERLMTPFEDHTTLEANKMVERHIGKWIRFVGNVFVVSEVEDVGPTVYVKLPMTGKQLYMISMSLLGSREQNKAKFLSKGQVISAVGKISGIDRYQITLEDGEFEVIESIPGNANLRAIG